MAGHKKRLWEKFRAEIIELDGGLCVRCGKSQQEGAILHVHHKSYVDGRSYWDYPAKMMETLCAGCHAKEHSIISPDCGWVLVSDDDLGSRVGTCDYCGNSLRRTYQITHKNWPTMDVGRDCCDLLTGTDEASRRETKRHNLAARRQRFIESDDWQWNDDGDGAWVKFALGHRIRLAWRPQGYSIHVDKHRGTEHHPTVADAKGAAFDAIEWLDNGRPKTKSEPIARREAAGGG